MKESDKKFNIGDQVEWSSTSGGFDKLKRGTIIARFDAGASVRSYFSRLQYTRHRSMYGGGDERNHETYAVEVPSKSGKGKSLVYWPRVSALNIVEP